MHRGSVGKIESGKATYTPQDETKVTFSAKITAEQERIDWSKPSQEIINLILALSPQTGAYTRMGETTLKIFDARLSDKQYDGRCGQVVECGKKVLAVLCGDGKAINVLQLQLQNAKRWTSSVFCAADGWKRGAALNEFRLCKNS